eukprot:952880-Prymnesium_polylepis.2
MEALGRSTSRWPAAAQSSRAATSSCTPGNGVTAPLVRRPLLRGAVSAISCTGSRPLPLRCSGRS